jgi:hypothetical protein
MEKHRAEDKYIAFDAYETLAEAYAALIDTSMYIQAIKA